MILVKRTVSGLGDLLMTLPGLFVLSKQFSITLQVLSQYEEFLKRFTFLQVTSKEQDNSLFDQVIDLNTCCIVHEQLSKQPPNRIDLFAEALNVSVEELPEIPLFTKEIEFVKQFQGINVFLHIASSDPKRNWPLENHIDLIQSLSHLPITFLVSDSERNEWAFKNVRDVSQFTLGEQVALIKHSDLFIGPDSGLMHMAGFLGTKSLIFFGSTNPESRLSYYPTHQAIMDHKLGCLSCLSPDEKVLKSNGQFVPIKQLKEADIVLDKDGIPSKVKAIHFHAPETPLYEVKYRDTNETLKITGNHKIPIFNGELTVKRVDELARGDFLLYPKALVNGSGLLDDQIITPQIAWLLGVLLTKCIKRDLFYVVSSRKKLLREVREALEAINTEAQESPLGLSFETDGILNQLLGPLTRRYVPLDLLTDDLLILESFLRGVAQGMPLNGEVTQDYSFKVYSESLALGIRHISTMFGKFPEVTHLREINYPKADRDYWTIVFPMQDKEPVFSFDRIVQTNKLFEDYILVPVMNIKLANSQPTQVVDLWVEGSESYNAKGLSVFNCWYRPCYNDLKCMTNIPVLKIAEEIISKLGIHP